MGTVVWLLVLVCVGWYVVHHWPEVQDFLQRALQALQTHLMISRGHRAHLTPAPLTG